MYKIQKVLTFLVRNLRYGDVVKRYHEIRDLPYQSLEEIERRQRSKINRVLQHAYEKVPYYRTLFEEYGLVENGKVYISDFKEMEKIPFLTKQIIGEKQEALHAEDIKERGGYKNSSGGSTGVPTVFMQDHHFQVNNLANFDIAREWRGAGLYDSTVKIWGAERDTYEGKKPLESVVKEFLLNYIILNTFSMSPETMRHYIELLNRHRPKLIITYVQSMYELAKYAKEHNIKVEKQNAIHTTAGTLFDFMRKEIEEVFQAPVFNHYGSRELGSIASECRDHNGLHIMCEQAFVEVVNKEGKQCRPGEEGEIVITTLENFSMPLIRYKIGDIGVMQPYTPCSCGCNYPKLQTVLGRSSDIIKTKSGSILVPEFFVYLIGVTCNRGNIKQFQVIQERIDELRLKIVKSDNLSQEELSDIEQRIKSVMGEECRVRFEFVDEIPKTPTGKFLYTISKI